MSGINQANIRGVAYTLDDNNLLSAVRAARDEAKTRGTKYDGLCKEYTAEWWRRLWQGVRWTAALFVGVPLLTAVWGLVAYCFYDSWPMISSSGLLGVAGVTTALVVASIVTRVAVAVEETWDDTLIFAVSDILKFMTTYIVALCILPLVSSAFCVGMLIRTWRGADLEEINQEMLGAYEWLMTPRMQMGQLLNEAIPTLNALAVIADVSSAVRRLVPPGYRFAGTDQSRQKARDSLWIVVGEMLTMVELDRVPSNDLLKEYERVVEAAKKGLFIDDRRVAQVMLLEMKEGR